MFESAFEWIRGTFASGDPVAEDAVRRSAAEEAPIVWLLGKVGAGKSSIIATITGDSSTTIGCGFKPCTRNSQQYDWPAEAPRLRFLDTRGLGEADYDPAEDIAFCETKAHALVVAMSVEDRNQAALLSAIRAIRDRHPEWPLIVAESHLHLAYAPDVNHPETYPFLGTEDDLTNPAVPTKLRVALRTQRESFVGMAGAPPRFVPLDFTRPDDGFVPPDFGFNALAEALTETGIAALTNVEIGKLAPLQRRAHNLVWGHATAAGVSGGVPVPGVGIGGMLTTIGLMLRALSTLYGIAPTQEQYLRFAQIMSGALAAGVSVRMGLAELAKFVPVYGSAFGATVNAAASFSMTYGIGRAAIRYMEMLKAGEAVDEGALRAAFEDGFSKRPGGGG
jgi:uncharacterized protein (DUF697 family)